MGVYSTHDFRATLAGRLQLRQGGWRRVANGTVGSLFVFLLAASAAPSQAETREARGGSWRWTQTAAGHQVGSADANDRLMLDLPAAARLTDFVGDQGGWLASAVENTDTRPSLKVLRGDAGSSWALPSPPIAGRELRSAVLAADGAKLQGLAWLEGDGERRLAVKSARWLGSAWGEVETVAEPGPGSQLALSSAQLTEGSWLLAWSAFDGKDDEILWSRRDKDGWSTPQRLGADDQAPDITPRLVALADGTALIAWSGYVDGHYRLHTARFADGEWSEPQISGEKGAVSPSFEISADRTYLLYRQAAPRTWVVTEVGATGKLARRAELVSSAAARPSVGAVDESRVELLWPEAKDLGSTAQWRTEAP